jgi:hypothetical protein
MSVCPLLWVLVSARCEATLRAKRQALVLSSSMLHTRERVLHGLLIPSWRNRPRSIMQSDQVRFYAVWLEKSSFDPVPGASPGTSYQYFVLLLALHAIGKALLHRAWCSHGEHPAGPAVAYYEWLVNYDGVSPTRAIGYRWVPAWASSHQEGYRDAWQVGVLAHSSEASDCYRSWCSNLSLLMALSLFLFCFFVNSCTCICERLP